MSGDVALFIELVPGLLPTWQPTQDSCLFSKHLLLVMAVPSLPIIEAFFTLLFCCAHHLQPAAAQAWWSDLMSFDLLVGSAS